jgi:hypothetical protein
MKTRTILAALALALAPTLAAAYCSEPKQSTSANACAEGQVFDAATGTCVTAPTT